MESYPAAGGGVGDSYKRRIRYALSSLGYHIGFKIWDPTEAADILPSWCFLTFFVVVFVFLNQFCIWLGSLLVTWWWYQGPTEVAQVVQLLLGGTLIHANARRFAVFPWTVSRMWRRFQAIDSYSRRVRQGFRKSLTHQQNWYLLLSAKMNRMSTVISTKWPPAGHWCEFQRPNNQKKTSLGWPECQAFTLAWR